jgi:hypothetical protein
MKVAQQIVGVNQRLGNTAVPNMQGTTRVIYDTALLGTGQDQTLSYFSGVSARAFPLANINNNRFEVGESLAVSYISFLFRSETITTLNAQFSNVATVAAAFTNSALLNFYIGNQRVVKDLEIATYANFNIGEVNRGTGGSTVIRLETPIIIPPQVEFFATLRLTTSAAITAQRLIFAIGGQGTLLNTKSTF